MDNHDDRAEKATLQIRGERATCAMAHEMAAKVEHISAQILSAKGNPVTKNAQNDLGN